jgi:selenocysteine lyase/cysteine desulfurase
MSCRLEELQALLNDRTRIVAFPHVSNLLGEIVDVAAITKLAHAAGARVVVDGVAYAPHRAMDVKAWGVDWYAYSTYKVYGPHMGAMFGRDEAIAELTGPNHFFIPRDAVPYKFELGGASHEGCAGLLALREYLNVLASCERTEQINRATVDAAFEIMTSCELPLQRRLIDWLRSRRDVRIIGPAHGEASRVATVSFVHDRLTPREVAAAAHAQDIGMRSGHMYAYRLCEALGIDVGEGVVRISAVHYNTIDEIERLIATLGAAFDRPV